MQKTESTFDMIQRLWKEETERIRQKEEQIRKLKREATHEQDSDS